MIGLVVVSHSRALARAAVEFATQMVPGQAPVIRIAAGLDEDTPGTDATAIATAISEADGGEGVLVLLDLGSAVLSAELALELLDADQAERVRLSSAPLVEGLAAATVAAATGADLTRVGAEAEQGLQAKVEHLGGTDAGSGDRLTGPRAGGDAAGSGAENAAGRTYELLIRAPHGLHARPAARFVHEVARHPEVAVQVRNLDTGAGPVDGRSLTGLATLEARQGHRVQVEATGESADDLLSALERLAESGFGDLAVDAAGAGLRGIGEVGRAARPPAPSPGGPMLGLEAAIGPAVRREPETPVADYQVGAVRDELAALDHAVHQVRAELSELVGRAADRLGAQQAAVFEAHLAILMDPAFQDGVRDGIRAGAGAPESVHQQTRALREQFEALTDPYQRARGEDMTAVGERVRRALGGPTASTPEEAGVLLLPELDPATAVLLDPEQLQGVVTFGGSATGHGVLLARARGIPVLTGVAAAAGVTAGTVVAFDARSGRFVADPDAATVSDFQALLAERAATRQGVLQRAAEPATTRDGNQVLVTANLASPADARQAATAGAEGAGLVRTEALFADRVEAPTVAEQVNLFLELSDQLGGGTLTIRTWDVGGDKPLAFLPQAQEANPFLGQRGLRAFTEHRELLVDQLEAICRVADERSVRVMFPMVSTRADVDWALVCLAEAASRLPAGQPPNMQVGVMVEVPAAALRASVLATGLDFVSIGSNDLVQYTMAAERGNPAVQHLADVAEPAVLHLIRATARGVGPGVDVCLCGDAASDPDLTGLLLGLGVTELSTTPVAVPTVKDAVRRWALPRARELADRALRAESAAQVRDLLHEHR